MVTDSETNFLYLADCLPKKHPEFAANLLQLLNEHGIKYALLPGTKDIWAVDYMPVQTGLNSFASFVYNPDYLQTKAGQKSISNVPEILNQIGVVTNYSDIVLDGGNVIKSNDTVIMCDKTFRENKHYSTAKLIAQLKQTFKVNRLIFLPTHKHDFTGHADGVVRFINNETVLINNYAGEDREYELALKIALNNAGLTAIELPYNPYNNKANDDATGIYINYLEMDGLIVMPVFNINEDEEALNKLTKVFPSRKVVTLPATEIAGKGGILNCISWNIKVTG